MATATKTPTIKSLLEYLYDSPRRSVSDVANEFTISEDVAQEILTELDENDGTLYLDGDETYSIEDKDSSFEDILINHSMTGGRRLTEELPVSKPKAKGRTKKAAPKKDSATAPKKRATKKKATPAVAVVAPEPEPTKKKAKPKAKKKEPKAAVVPAPEPEVTPEPEAPKVKAKRVVTPRASRVVEDTTEAKALNVDVGTEVKTCVDCKETFAKFGGQFRPRFRDPDQPELAKHVQPRCIACDKLRSRRKSRFTGLRRVIGVEDIGNPEQIITHPDRKSGGTPDGKFSVALVDDSVSGFTPNLRGVIVNMAEGLIKIRWVSDPNPEIVGATQKCIKASKDKSKAVTAPVTTEVTTEAPTAPKKKVVKKPVSKPKAKKKDKPTKVAPADIWAASNDDDNEEE